jgi:proteasome lid subunit RPN8/RPN11
MRWTDLPPEAEVRPPEQLLARWAEDSVEADLWRQRLASDTASDTDTAPLPWVLIERRAVEEALAIIGLAPEERGGLLVGSVFGHRLGGPQAVLIRTAIASAGAEASPVSLRLPADVWTAARAARQPGERVVGWFHSHPGLGAFFSDTDRQTQAAFFREPTSLGWVIDPLRTDQAWFVGRDANALPLPRIAMV